jgi:hypothetical protein
MEFELTGTRLQPQLTVTFPYTDTHTRDLLKKLTDRHWDKQHRHWVIDGLGPNPAETLHKLHAPTSLTLADGTTITQLFTPCVDTNPTTHTIRVWPRLTGPTHLTSRLIPGATPTPLGWHTCDPIDLIQLDGTPRPGLIIHPDTLQHALTQWDQRVTQPRAHYNPTTADLTARIATSVDPTNLEPHLTPIPDWFGLDLYPYQRLGVTAMLNGHGFLADPPGGGKCHSKDTLILMADGTTKPIETIQVGEQVQSQHGPNTVTYLHHGYGLMYTITPTKGQPFTVTDQHLLTVTPQSAPRTPGQPRHLTDLPIQQLMQRATHPNGTLRGYKLYRPAITNYTTKPQTIPPYILGLWLGDGHSSRPALTTADQIIADTWTQWGESLGCHTSIRRKHIPHLGRDSKAWTIGLIVNPPHHHNHPNPAAGLLRALNLLDNKHIPLNYLTGDWQQRSHLLAGIIDTDGHIDHGGCDMIFKHQALAQHVTQLAHGLGLACYIHPEPKQVAGHPETRRIYYRCHISGDLTTLPLKLRVAPPRRQTKNVQVTGFTITPAGDGEYFGIGVDGDHRYLLADNTITHNTRTALAVVAASHPTGRTLIICPPIAFGAWTWETTEAHLAHPTQTWDWLPTQHSHPTGTPADSGSQLVVWQAGRKHPNPPNCGVLVLPDTLLDNPTIINQLTTWQPDIIIYDEAHRTRTTTSKRTQAFLTLTNSLPNTVVYPMTGTGIMTGSPSDLQTILTATRHIDWVFGGTANYLGRFCTLDPWGKWQPNKKALPDLRRLLNQHVWVRREKTAMLPWLPPKTHHTQIVNTDLTSITTERRNIIDRLTTWHATYTKEHGQPPDDQTIHDYAITTSLTIMSRLRIETGLAKTPATIDWAMQHATPDNPIVIWAYSTDVINHIAVTLNAPTITGTTPIGQRATIAQQFQHGDHPILICQLQAAGVAITLTRATDILFTETDWLPDINSQAEDRHHRPGTTQPVTITRLHAPGTLDDRMWHVQTRKDTATQTVMTPNSPTPWDTIRIPDTSPTRIIETLLQRIRDGATEKTLLTLI